jgi:hypothetical protein
VYTLLNANALPLMYSVTRHVSLSGRGGSRGDDDHTTQYTELRQQATREADATVSF